MAKLRQPFNRHINREKIRAQLLESAERIHQAALSDAAKAKGWEEREADNDALVGFAPSNTTPNTPVAFQQNTNDQLISCELLRSNR
jgi:hypothetical protein